MGQSTDSGRAGIVGVISTLEHTRGLVAGRSCSLSADTDMVTHERFWTEFLVAPSSYKSYISFPQHVRHAGTAKLGQVYFSFVTCHIMTVMTNLTWLTQSMGSCLTREEFELLAKVRFYTLKRPFSPCCNHYWT